MKLKTVFLICLIVMVFSSLPNVCSSAEQNLGSVNMNISDNNYALITQRRLVQLNKGINQVTIDNIPQTIDPASVAVQFELPSGEKGKIKILEQTFKTPPLNPPSDLSSKANLPEKKYSIESGRPVLTWQIFSEKAGEYPLTLQYMASNITWKADYLVTFNGETQMLDILVWVTIKNETDASFQNAQVRLLSTNKEVKDTYPVDQGRIVSFQSERGYSPSAQVTNFPFVIYEYPMERKINIEGHETKQILYTQADEIPYTRKYIYEGNAAVIRNIIDSKCYISQVPLRQERSWGKETQNGIYEYLEFKNDKEKGLGQPLPRGKVRVYRKEQDYSLSWIADDSLENASSGDITRIRIGMLKDVLGQRIQVDFKPIVPDHLYDEIFEIKLTSYQKQDINIEVIEHLYRWPQWKIVESSQEFKQTGQYTIHFEVVLPAEGEKNISYTVRYKW